MRYSSSLYTCQYTFEPSDPDTDIDYAVRLVSLEDDPHLPIFTFRMWFLALGLSCFGAVLGQIFVSRAPFTADRGDGMLIARLSSQYFRPQTITVSQLFLQVRSDSCASLQRVNVVFVRFLLLSWAGLWRRFCQVLRTAHDSKLATTLFGGTSVHFILSMFVA